MATSAFEWDRIDTLLVDMDGTLLDLAFDNFFWLDLVPREYAARHGIPHDDARRDLTVRFDGAVGKLEWYCIDYWSRELGLDIKGLKARHRHLVRFLPRAPEFLAEARARGKQVCIVTNAHRETFAVKALATRIDTLVDHVVCSHDFAVPKEDLEFWQRLPERQPFDPARTLLLEDSLAVLATARAAGLAHTIAIRRPDSRRPARAISDYPAVDGVADLLGAPRAHEPSV
jgi:putative hydrolase of the HAD superfamily